MVALTAVLSACGAKTKNTKSSSILDPDNPVSLTVWHYYNGAQQAAFDELVSEFNGTTGKDLGIYVEGYSQGSISDLEKAVSDSFWKKHMVFVFQRKCVKKLVIL